jgi:hypothetical protein
VVARVGPDEDASTAERIVARVHAVDIGLREVNSGDLIEGGVELQPGRQRLQIVLKLMEVNAAAATSVGSAVKGDRSWAEVGAAVFERTGVVEDAWPHLETVREARPVLVERGPCRSGEKMEEAGLRGDAEGRRRMQRIDVKVVGISRRRQLAGGQTIHACGLVAVESHAHRGVGKGIERHALEHQIVELRRRRSRGWRQRLVRSLPAVNNDRLLGLGWPG